MEVGGRERRGPNREIDFGFGSCVRARGGGRVKTGPNSDRRVFPFSLFGAGGFPFSLFGASGFPFSLAPLPPTSYPASAGFIDHIIHDYIFTYNIYIYISYM